MDEIRLWRWRYTNEFGKRVESSWLMSEDTIRQFAHVYRDAEKIPNTLEIRQSLGSTSSFQQSPRKS